MSPFTVPDKPLDFADWAEGPPVRGVRDADPETRAKIEAALQAVVVIIRAGDAEWHVSRRLNGAWQVKRVNAKRASTLVETQQEAVEAARRYAEHTGEPVVVEAAGPAAGRKPTRRRARGGSAQAQR